MHLDSRKIRLRSMNLGLSRFGSVPKFNREGSKDILQFREEYLHRTYARPFASPSTSRINLPSRCIVERYKQHRGTPGESRNYKLRGQIYPRIDQRERTEKKGGGEGGGEGAELTKRVQKNGHPSSARGSRRRVLEGSAFVREGYNGLTSHGEVSGSCPKRLRSLYRRRPRIAVRPSAGAS